MTWKKLIRNIRTPPHGYYRFLRMFTRSGRAHNRRVEHLWRNQPAPEVRP